MMSILLIDKNLPAIELLREQLVLAGYMVFPAEGGLAGLKMTHVASFDLVITEIRLPETNGLEVIANLKMKKSCPKIIAMLRGSRRGMGDPLLSAARTLGADRILLKPFSFDELLACMRELGMEQAQAPISKAHSGE